jgi:hypothetical protein
MEPLMWFKAFRMAQRGAAANTHLGIEPPVIGYFGGELVAKGRSWRLRSFKKLIRLERGLEPS